MVEHTLDRDNRPTCIESFCVDNRTNKISMPDLMAKESPAVCAGCGGRIVDRYYLLTVDKRWHVNCLKCCECKVCLDTELTCFARDGNIYCKEDYYRHFGVKRCSRCHQGILANELVMRARDLVYHLTCFTCAGCNKVLNTGDQFGMKGGLVYCRADYEVLFQGDYIPTLSPELGDSTGQIPYYNGVGALQKGRPRKRRSPHLHSEEYSQNIGLGSDRSDLLDRDSYQPAPRQKRMRTSFKHHQLRTLKSYFALNHNPDAKDLKQLSQKTGLTKRVLQVWFQNARAKYRRNIQKQEQDRLTQAPSSQTQQSGAGSADKLSDSSSLVELSNDQSPALSDISSTPSLSDLQGSCLDSDHSNNSLSDFFPNGISSLNS